MPAKAGLIIFLLMTALCSASQDITGLWQGTIYNDTTQQFYKYEIAISEHKGKLSGYSHTWFILDGKQYYGVKKVKVRKMDGKIIIEDDGLVANNYPVTPAKNIRQLNILTYGESDSSRTLTGPFTTNRTREYRSLTGKIDLKRKKDFQKSSLVPHLEELNLKDQLSFVATDEIEKGNVVKNGRTSATPNRELATSKVKKEEIDNVRKEASPTLQPAKPLPPAAEVNSREEVVQRSVDFSSDSLFLTLFDNGEVDGDTVSVLANGIIIIPKARLSTTAIQYALDVSGVDSIKLVMYAENLGTIAPNTGLLLVKDGRDLHEIRFSGNLNQNAAIVFRKKKVIN